ncbi:MAG TPA: glycerophosphodiester phosphodiesterase [Spirochaetota bacterium]|nr:glycerophosphodiester phosphodiesterase [Spirochaetota bacterium]
MTSDFFREGTMIIGHRGVPVEFPANTMPSFKRAEELDVDVINTEVYLSADGIPVIIQDENLEEISDGKGRVTEYTLEDLQQLDTGYHFTIDDGKTYPFRGKGLTFLSLEQLLTEFPHQHFIMDIMDNNPQLVDRFLDSISRCDAEDRVCAASRYASAMKRIRKKNPNLATSFSLWGVLGFYFLFRSGILAMKQHFKGDVLQIPEYIGPSHLANGGLVRAAHDRGIKVYVWTVNDRQYIRRLLDIEVDGIITDNPELLKSLI